MAAIIRHRVQRRTRKELLPKLNLVPFAIQALTCSDRRSPFRFNDEDIRDSRHKNVDLLALLARASLDKAGSDLNATRNAAPSLDSHGGKTG